MSAALSFLVRWRAAPVFMCGFRPFFILTAVSAVVFILMWLASLSGWTGLGWLAAIPGGAMMWHAHEMIYGFVAASIAGFLLTAIPEFTNTGSIARLGLFRLVLLWGLARLAYVLSAWWPGVIGLWPAAVLNAMRCLCLLAPIRPA